MSYPPSPNDSHAQRASMPCVWYSQWNSAAPVAGGFHMGLTSTPQAALWRQRAPSGPGRSGKRHKSGRTPPPMPPPNFVNPYNQGQPNLGMGMLQFQSQLWYTAVPNAGAPFAALPAESLQQQHMPMPEQNHSAVGLPSQVRELSSKDIRHFSKDGGYWTDVMNPSGSSEYDELSWELATQNTCLAPFTEGVDNLEAVLKNRIALANANIAAEQANLDKMKESLEKTKMNRQAAFLKLERLSKGIHKEGEKLTPAIIYAVIRRHGHDGGSGALTSTSIAERLHLASGNDVMKLSGEQCHHILQALAYVDYPNQEPFDNLMDKHKRSGVLELDGRQFSFKKIVGGTKNTNFTKATLQGLTMIYLDLVPSNPIYRKFILCTRGCGEDSSWGGMAKEQD